MKFPSFKEDEIKNFRLERNEDLIINSAKEESYLLNTHLNDIKTTINHFPSKSIITLMDTDNINLHDSSKIDKDLCENEKKKKQEPFAEINTSFNRQKNRRQSIYDPMQIRMSANQLESKHEESEQHEMDSLESLEIKKSRSLEIKKSRSLEKKKTRQSLQISSSIIEFNSLTTYTPAAKSPLNNEYQYADIENIILSFMLAAMYGILIKVVSNMISKACYIQSECDCSNESYPIKLWTLYLADHEAILMIIVLYKIAPETTNFGKNSVLGLIALNILMISVLAVIIPGNIEAYDYLKYGFLIFNPIFQFLLMSFYFYKTKLFRKFMLSYGFFWFLILFLFQILTILSTYLAKLGLMIEDSQKIFWNSFYGLVLISLYALVSRVLPRFLEHMQSNYSFHKYIIAIDLTYLSLIGLALGLMFNTRSGYWPFIFYLIVYLINSIEIQTAIISKAISHTIFFCKKKIYTQNQPILKIPIRSPASKLKAGRQIFFTFSIGLRLICIAISNQWTDYFQGYSSGCNFNIPHTSDITFAKVGILFLCDMFVNGMCYYINKKNGFINIKYEKSTKDLLLESLIYYFYGFIIETRMKSLLANA